MMERFYNQAVPGVQVEESERKTTRKKKTRFDPHHLNTALYYLNAWNRLKGLISMI